MIFDSIKRNNTKKYFRKKKNKSQQKNCYFPVCETVKYSITDIEPTESYNSIKRKISCLRKEENYRV